MIERPLGRITPPDTNHIEAAPLSDLPVHERPTHVPVTIGIPWFTAFDQPYEQNGEYYFPASNLGTVRGGHCVCLEPAPQPDQPGEEQDQAEWWAFYNQGVEGACEGFGHARSLSLLYRRKFDAFWLYDDARRIEGTFPNGEGSTNRAVAEALVKWGAHFEDGQIAARTSWHKGVPGVQIAGVRWATTWQEVLDTLGFKEGPVPLLNSWGTAYPQRVWVPDEVGVQLIEKEDGEADVFVEH